MPKLKLRSFLYLDEIALDQYLSQIKGGVLEGPYSSKDTSNREVGGKAGLDARIANFSGQAGRGSSSEVERTIRVTPEAKFTELYDLLKGKSPDDSQIQALSGFDQDIYDQIEAGEIIEVRGQGRLPKWEQLKETVGSLSGILEVMKLAGQDPFEDPAARLGYEGVSKLISAQENNGTFLLVSPLNAPNFTLYARIEPDKILRRKQDLESDVTLLGKVQKILLPGDRVDIFRLMPELTSLSTPTPSNRASRRASRKGNSKSVDTSSPWDEGISYPAIQVQPVAVFQ